MRNPLQPSPYLAEAIGEFFRENIRENKDGFVGQNALFRAARTWIRRHYPGIDLSRISDDFINIHARKTFPNIGEFQPEFGVSRYPCYSGIDFDNDPSKKRDRMEIGPQIDRKKPKDECVGKDGLCRKQVDWQKQKHQYGRAMEAGMTEEEYKQIAPICQKCMTTFLNRRREQKR